MSSIAPPVHSPQDICQHYRQNRRSLVILPQLELKTGRAVKYYAGDDPMELLKKIFALGREDASSRRSEELRMKLIKQYTNKCFGWPDDLGGTMHEMVAGLDRKKKELEKRFVHSLLPVIDLANRRLPGDFFELWKEAHDSGEAYWLMANLLRVLYHPKTDAARVKELFKDWIRFSGYLINSCAVFDM